MSTRLTLSPRAQAALVIALVAALGALLGIMGDRLVAQQRADAPPARVDGMPRGGPGPLRPGEGRYSDRLVARLDLSPEQRAAVDSILAEEQLRLRELTREFQPQFRAIAVQTRTRVEAVLTPDQRERLRALRSDRVGRVGDDRPWLRDAVRPGTVPADRLRRRPDADTMTP